MLTNGRPFFEFLREERVFCATLAHLLMTRGSNVETFIDLVNQQLDGDSKISTNHPADAEIYLEFSFVRDWWDGLGTASAGGTRTSANAAKHSLLLELMRRIPTLHDLAESLPGASDPAAFNRRFRDSTRLIANDIASPVHWTLSAIASLTQGNPPAFRDLCRLKWAFNIKPDLIIMLPDATPVCVEAKLESAEDTYPSGQADCSKFDSVVGAGQRVGQIELQQFLFRYLLDRPCQAVVVTKVPRSRPAHSLENAPVPVLSWGKVFSHLDHGDSIPFVHRFLSANKHLEISYAWDRMNDEDLS
ncbi:MAG: hypothetical protein ACSLFM_13780 [Tepidiformaceae bacterium]